MPLPPPIPPPQWQTPVLGPDGRLSQPWQILFHQLYQTALALQKLSTEDLFARGPSEGATLAIAEQIQTLVEPQVPMRADLLEELTARIAAIENQARQAQPDQDLGVLLEMAASDGNPNWGENADAHGYDLNNLGKLRVGPGTPSFPLHVETANAGTVIGSIYNTSAAGSGVAVRVGSNSNYALSVQDATTANNSVMLFGDGRVQIAGPNIERWTHGFMTEEITLSTGGATTDSVANLLPDNSIIEAVVARVTTTITVATDWKLGDGTTAGRFTAAQSGGQLTAGATVVGLVHADQTGAAGPIQSSAAKLRITTTGTPGAGKIRVTVFYRQFTAPLS